LASYDPGILIDDMIKVNKQKGSLAKFFYLSPF
jgi:hypothetical protein